MSVIPFTRRATLAMELTEGPGAHGAVVPFSAALHWVEHARAGEELVYGIGHLPSWSATPKRLYELYEQGLVSLTTDGSKTPKEYVAQRTAAPWTGIAPERRRISRTIAPSSDDMARLLKVLQAEARTGMPCSSNAALAIKAGLSDGNRASYLLKKLVAAGKVENVATEWWPGRQVTDMATGAKTRVDIGRHRHQLASGQAGAK